MRTLLISDDSLLLTLVKDFGKSDENSVTVYENGKDPVKVLSNILSVQPSLLIMDDDYLAPNTVSILESLRKINDRMKIIFVTSDSGIELGKAVSQLGIYFYAIKPVEEEELKALFNSLLKSRTHYKQN
ncbi:response regulator [bacterium BMS3Abin03]|nr:response regulator [bacterium BMS3Abin03]MCG6959171.1 response regulator [bacterium BMS3Abin03]